MEVILQKSNKPDKTVMALIDGKIIHFGATGYEDFTMH